MIPAMETKEKFLEAISKDEPADYMFGHDDIAGFSHEGIMVTEEKSINIKELSKYGHAILGHIHKAQAKGNITYVGSAYHTRKNEWENSPHIMVINLDTSKYNFIKNIISPKYVNIYVDDLLEMTVDEANEAIKNNKVSIFVDDFNKINTTKISEFLTGQYSLKYEQKVGKIYSQNEVDNNSYDENIKYETVDDIKKTIIEYIESNDSFIIDKQMIAISTKAKETLITKLNNLYNASKDKVKMIDDNN